MGNYISETGGSEVLDNISASYWPVHGYLSAVICVFGILGNTANVIVLTRRNMHSATNILLTGLAASDGARMVFYLVYVLHNVVIYPGFETQENLTYTNAAMEFMYTVVGIPLNAISIWITITLAIFRVLATKLPLEIHRYCSKERAMFSVVLINVIICLTHGIPNFMAHEVTEIPAEYMGFFDNNGTVWALTILEETESQRMLQTVLFWMTAILHMIVPCLLLAILSGVLIHSLHAAIRRKEKLTPSAKRSDGHGDGQFDNSKIKQKVSPKDTQQRRDSRRTTTMLLVIVLLFLMSELPHGILHVFNGLVDGFLMNVYVQLLFFIDLVSLINSGFNFMLYCAMSREFRRTFMAIFFQRFLAFRDGSSRSSRTTDM